MFSQAHYNTDAANQSVRAGDPMQLNCSACTTNEYYWGYERTAYMMKHIGDIFEDAFGKGERPNGRVRPVLAGQIGGFTNAVGLKYLDAVHGPPRGYTHALAAAPYFGSPADKQDPNATVDQIIAGFQQGAGVYRPSTNVSRGANPLAQSALNAALYGLRLRAYESGTGSGSVKGKGENCKNNAAAQMDPRMKAIVEQYESNLNGNGLYSPNWFVFIASNYDDPPYCFAWGISNDPKTFTSPKFEGLMAHQAKPPPLMSLGKSVPATLNASVDQMGSRWPYQPAWRYLDTNQTAEFVFRVDPSSASTPVLGGTKVQLTLGYKSSKDGSIDVSVDGAHSVVPLKQAETGGTSPPIPLDLAPGLHGIQLRVLTEDMEPHSRAPYSIESLSLE